MSRSFAPLFVRCGYCGGYTRAVGGFDWRGWMWSISSHLPCLGKCLLFLFIHLCPCRLLTRLLTTYRTKQTVCLIKVLSKPFVVSFHVQLPQVNVRQLSSRLHGLNPFKNWQRNFWTIQSRWPSVEKIWVVINVWHRYVGFVLLMPLADVYVGINLIVRSFVFPNTDCRSGTRIWPWTSSQRLATKVPCVTW